MPQARCILNGNGVYLVQMGAAVFYVRNEVMIMLEMTASDIELQEALITRIAKLVTMNVAHKQIAVATGVSATIISDVIANPKVVQKVQEITTADIEQQDLVNRGWDGIEEAALGTVLETLQATPDPDYALRAAALANKAQRRGSGNEPINGKTSTTATIELNAVFIERLQTITIGIHKISEDAKRVDTLDVQQTQELFHESNKNPLDDLFNKVADEVSYG